MFRHIVFRNFRDPVWSKVTTLGTTLFLIFLADAILSFWLPNYMQEVLGSAFLMGLFLSFSSVVGIAVDMFLPQIIKGITVHNLLTLGIVSGGLFALLLLYSTWIPAAFVFLIAMAVWGIYYEFFGFAEQQFVADATPLRMHSAVWAILGIFKNLAYFLGPLMAGYLVLGGERMPVVGAMIFSTCGFITLVASKGVHKRPVKIDTEEVSLRKEIGHWRTLFGRIWPVLTLSMLMGLVDATYWTTGTVLTAKLAQKNILGSLFLPAYMLPTLFVGIVIAKKKIIAWIILALYIEQCSPLQCLASHLCTFHEPQGPVGILPYVSVTFRVHLKTVGICANRSGHTPASWVYDRVPPVSQAAAPVKPPAFTAFCGDTEPQKPLSIP